MHISPSEKLVGSVVFHLEFLRKGFLFCLLAYQLVENWFDAALFRGGFTKSCNLRIRKGGGLLVSMASLLVGGIRLSPNGKNTVLLGYKGKKYHLHYSTGEQLATTISGINEQFLERQYSRLDVAGREVVDIGASFGDSALYFVINGAKRVIAFEPFPFAYSTALRNVRANGLGKKVLLVNKACASHAGSMLVDPSFESNDRDEVRNFRKGKRVDTVSLKDIAKEYRPRGAVLKIDCEGYEYDIIDKCDVRDLQGYDQVAIEYHFGYRDLQHKLESAGFRVWHTIPMYAKHIDNKTNALYGFLFAVRERGQGTYLKPTHAPLDLRAGLPADSPALLGS